MGVCLTGRNALITFRTDTAFEASVHFGKGFRFIKSQGNFVEIAFPVRQGDRPHAGSGNQGFSGDIRLFIAVIIAPAPLSNPSR